MNSIIIFVFGLTIGSFLNVLIQRLPKSQSILGRSKCPNCKTKLNWQDLLPVFSFLFLAGKCRHCSEKINISYPLVELLTAFLFLAVFNGGLGYFVFFIVSILLVLAFADIKFFILPDKIIFSGFFATLLFLVINIFYKGTGVCALSNCNLKAVLFGAGFLGGLFLFLYLVSSGRWIGFGDVKLGFFLGFFSGFYWSLNIFYLAVIAGAAVSVFSLTFGANLKTKLPLGAFLSLSAIAVILAKLDFIGIILRF